MTSRPGVADSAGYTDEPRAREWDFLRVSSSRLPEEDQNHAYPCRARKRGPFALLPAYRLHQAGLGRIR
jgi:hypothetical protein